jgi:hypothetical protein
MAWFKYAENLNAENTIQNVCLLVNVFFCEPVGGRITPLGIFDKFNNFFRRELNKLGELRTLGYALTELKYVDFKNENPKKNFIHTHTHIYIYIYTHTHTHTHIYIYIYIYIYTHTHS